MVYTVKYFVFNNHGIYSLSGRMSYRKLSSSLDAARLGLILFQSQWNLTGTALWTDAQYPLLVTWFNINSILDK